MLSLLNFVCLSVKCNTPKITKYTENASCKLMENRPEANCEVQFINGIKIVYNAEKKIIELRDSNDHQPLKFKPNDTEIGMALFIIVYTLQNTDLFVYLSHVIDFVSNFRLFRICQRIPSAICRRKKI